MSDDPHANGQGLTSLAPGDRLGPYEVVGLIGSGGMGEVYRAHDPRLGRPVALKILRGSSHDAEHVARFAREARAAGSLNHPNIVAVFDIAREAGVPYVVTELLEGETLRARLNRGPVPYRKAVDYGIQIAQALDAAHGKGIWHRDVKPANIFLTDDGRVKLLDFGIAKLSERDTIAGPRDPTVESTQAGEVRGTAGYMSPEQVLGEPVDHRSDIFALGSILYEMFTGTRAFQRPSNIETMNAVLQEDPPELLSVSPKLPPAAAAIVERCLEKNKEERFQSARDLAFDLQQLREQTSSSRALPVPQPSLRRVVLPVLLALAASAAMVLGTILALQPPPPSPLTFDQLTFRRGRIGGARFTPDGQAVIYSEALQSNALQVWRLFLTDRTARALDYQSGTDLLAIRRNGELVLSTGRRFIVGERFVGNLAVAEAGGAPRQVGENVEDADAHPVTGELAVVHSSGDMTGQSQIEYPIGTPIYTTDGSIRFLRFSRDGRQLAFVEDLQSRGVGGRLGVIAASVGSTPTYLRNEPESVRGLAWSATGNEIWFTAGPRSNRELRAIALDKKERLIYAAPGSLTLWDIAQDGRVLLTRDEERRTVMGVAPGEKTERDLSLFDNAGIADISNDGQSILMGDRNGLYMRPTSGAPPTSQGIRGFGDDISDDGSMILATEATDSSRQLVILRRGAVKPEPLQPFGITSYSGARFFASGQKVVFSGKKDRFLRSYVQDIVGGAPVPITPERTWGIAISPDDAWVAATGPDRLISLWPTSGSGPSRPVKGSEPDDRPVAWSQDQKSLWTFRRGEIPAQVFQIDLTTGHRQPWKTLVPPDTAGVYSVIEVRVTPTGSAYGYSYTRLLSQLYLTRGLQ